MNALYYFGIIEGVLHAKGEDAYPIKLWHAMRMLAEELKAPCMLSKETPITSKVQEAISRGIDEAQGVDNKWETWQLDLLKKMKEKGEKSAEISIACEKTQTQVNNKWQSIKSKNKDDLQSN